MVKLGFVRLDANRLAVFGGRFIQLFLILQNSGEVVVSLTVTWLEPDLGAEGRGSLLKKCGGFLILAAIPEKPCQARKVPSVRGPSPDQVARNLDRQVGFAFGP